MILRNFRDKTKSGCLTQIMYKNSRFDKFIYIIRGLLNKMTNEDNRNFNQSIAQNMDKNLPSEAKKIPKNALQAQKILQQNLKLVETFQKGRLKRLDQILGTKTYFHETKMYHHRVDSQYVIQVSQLKQKHREASREHVDLLNPQIPKYKFLRSRRKHAQFLQTLKIYPAGNSELQQFQQRHSQNGLGKKQMQNDLIQFLSQQTLYSRLALNQLQFTIDSINKQKVIIQKEGKLIDLQLQQNQFIYNGQIYFQPSNTMSIYRMDYKQYTKQISTNIDRLSEALGKNIGNCREIISLSQVYQCLKQYYYDERVSEYLGKVQNQQIQYFLSDLQISPDANSIFIVIDLMGTKKQYVGIYKKLPQSPKINQNQPSPILIQNVIFNIQPNTALRNKGELYCVQRSEQGLFIQFTKVRFIQSNKSKANKNKLKNNKQIQKQIIREQEQDGQNQIVEQNLLERQIIYRCKPYQQLKIIPNSINLPEQSSQISSTNILLQQRNIGQVTNNRIYLVRHRPGTNPYNSQGKSQVMQLITQNNNKLPDLFKKWRVSQRFGHITNWQTNEKVLYNQCFQIIGVGYLVVRYLLSDGLTGNYLKYGYNKKYAYYATLVPFKGIQLNSTNDHKPLISQNRKQETDYLPSHEKKNSISQTKPQEHSYEQFQLQLSQISNRISYIQPDSNDWQLQLHNQHIIYVCPEQQYITNLGVKHSSTSNIYLLINKSIQSVYDKNSLYVHPLRKGVVPYSIYLDGFPIQILDRNTGHGHNSVLYLKLLSPMLSVALQYTLWKRQMTQTLNNRIYTQNITIKENQDGESIVIKLLSSSNFIKRSKGKNYQSQPVILYLPSRNERLDQIVLQKMIEKGVIFIQILKARGIFGTNMVDLLRGSKSNYQKFIDDIYETILFVKQNIGQHIGIYADGASTCLATLLLNITQNQANQLFDCSVLHQGIYDLSKINKQYEYFFGQNPSVFKKINLYKLPIFDPTKSPQNNQQQSQEDQIKIKNLSNIVFASSSDKNRIESRKFVNKLRKNNKVLYDSVYLQQFDSPAQKDIVNLSYLYKIMKQKMNLQYKQFQKQKYKQISRKGAAQQRKSVEKANRDGNPNKQV